MNSVHKIWEELKRPKKKEGYSIRRFGKQFIYRKNN